MKKEIKSGTQVIAKVAIMGAKRGTGWMYTAYEADATLKSGYRYQYAVTAGMYPNKRNEQTSEELEQGWRASGYIIVNGRPNQRSRSNAPKVRG
jgi:hypothetical protein